MNKEVEIQVMVKNPKEAEKKLRKEGYPYLIYRKKQGNCKSSLTYWTPLRSLNATDLS